MNRFNSAKNLVAFFTAVAPNAKISQIFDSRSLARIHQIADRGKCEREMEKQLKKLSSNDSNSSYERKVLPPELSRSVATLTCESSAAGGVCDVYLVGTCHVSTESCEEVRAVIQFLKPQVVFLELCHRRKAVLKPQSSKKPTIGELFDVWKKEKESLLGILYSSYLRKVARQLEVEPGAEFRVAYEEAMKYDGKIILGDRPVQITLQRTWAMMPLGHKIKFFLKLFFRRPFFDISSGQVNSVIGPEDIAKRLKELNDVDNLTRRIEKLSEEFPTLAEALIHERDQYMSAMLLKVAREHNSVVAVVGKGHLPGIQKNWKQPVKMDQLLKRAN
ncbi:uncharacterized protein LOC131012662 isoform X1 [Salvia miltiorrhiza]|uniref:uncharacterized protein LOC131012662 isoform X1 n=1 Tax=Salvia miltiorrhiza TaxID=226208 RepID=UPI0025ACD356|nr:uncharacterized protein LOC131012662 isoform X1 [Salvia miltiorrhiza]